MNLSMIGAPRGLRIAAAIVSACFLVTACSSAISGPKVTASAPAKPPATTTQAQTPAPVPTTKVDLTLRVPDHLDPFGITATKDLAGLDSYALEWGLEHVYAVNQTAMEHNIEGVALFGKYCVVLFSHVNGAEELNILVVSRYNDLLDHRSEGLHLPDGVLDALAQTKNACWTGDYYPEPGDGAAVSI